MRFLLFEITDSASRFSESFGYSIPLSFNISLTIENVVFSSAILRTLILGFVFQNLLNYCLWIKQKERSFRSGSREKKKLSCILI